MIDGEAMKKHITKSYLSLLFLTFSASVGAIESGTATHHIETISVKSCDIILPDLGVSNVSVLNTLKEKGYLPRIANDMYLQGGGSVFILGAAVKVMKPDFHLDPELAGTMYVDLEITTNGLVNQTRLNLKVFGLSASTPLFISRGYDANFLPGHEDLFEVDDFPSCR